MAEPLIGPSAIATIEEAVHLLRRTPVSTLVCHLAGTAPFALGLLFYWSTVTNPRTAAPTTAMLSLAMTVLLVWMNAWRAIFAVGLSRTGLLAYRPQRVWTLLSTQSFLGATKLLAIPLAALTMFPLAGAVAFYRYAATHSIGKARKLATLDPGGHWTLLLILQLLWLLALLNVGLALAILPHLARMLTGYDSAFTRSGQYYILNPLFFILAFAVTWMLIDPLVQAVYTVRSFHLESLETGEDLRTALRRIRAAAPVAGAVVLMLAAAPRAGAAIPPETLRESVRQAVRSPEYDWRLPPEPAKASRPWLVEITDRMIDRMRGFFQSIGRGIERVLRWLFRSLLGSGPKPVGGAAPGGLHWSVGLVTALVLGAGAWLVWRWRNARGNTETRPAPAVQQVRLDAEDLSPARLPEEQWLELADQCLRQREYRLALRAFYLANLAWLGQCEYLSLHFGKTNREYEAELRRRARAFPEARALFAANLAMFERAWYGTSTVGADDASEFRRRAGEIKHRLQAAGEAAA